MKGPVAALGPVGIRPIRAQGDRTVANFTGDETDNAIFGTDEADLIKGLGGDDNL